MNSMRLRFLGVLLLMVVFGNASAVESVKSAAASEPQRFSQKTIEESHEVPSIIGVLALNSFEEAQEQWKPLEDYLNQKTPNLHFKIKPLGFHEVLPAIDNGEIDYLIANPAFYSIGYQKGKAYALATLVRQVKNANLASFGGVIFSRLGVSVEDIAKLNQEQIAAVAPYSLGGYLVQKKLLKDRFNVVLNDRRVHFYQSHKDVVNAVISGERKVGFVRTGVLEVTNTTELFEVVQTQNPIKSLFKLSTPLYPEWPFAALNHIPFEDAQEVLQALLGWDSGVKKSNFASFEHGLSWTVAQSYLPITELLKQLPVEAYEQKQPQSFQESLAQYQEWALFFLALLLGLILMTSLLSRKQFWFNWQSKQLSRELEKREELIQELKIANEALLFQKDRFQVLSDSSSEGVIIFSFSGHIEYINPHALRFWGKENATIDRLNAYHLFSDVDDRRKIHKMMESLNESVQSPVFLDESIVKLVCADGTLKDVKLNLSAIMRNDKWFLVMNFIDSYEQKNYEKNHHRAVQFAQTFMELMDQAVFTLNLNFELQLVNHQSCQVLSMFVDDRLCENRDAENSPLKEVASRHINFIETWFSEEEQADLTLQLRELQREDTSNMFVYQVAPSNSTNLKGWVLRFHWVKSTDFSEDFYLCFLEKASANSHRAAANLVAANEQTSLLDNNQIGMLIVDAKGNVRYANKAVEELLGASNQSLLGSHFGVPSSLDETILHEFEIVMANGSAGVAEFAYTQTQWQGELAYLVFMYDVTDLKIAKQEANYQAMHDALTGLSNRRFFIQYLDNMIEANRLSHSPFSLVLIDVIGFGKINETFGFKSSDAILVEIAHRLKTTMRASDVVARLGSDKFALLLRGVENQEMLQSLVKKVIQGFAEPIRLAEGSLNVSIKMGGVIHPNYGHGSVELLKMADAALAQAKNSSNLHFVVFSDFILAASGNAFSLEAELSQAVAQKEFVLVYQPQMNVVTGECVGVEALLRWNHPNKGLISPNVFLSLLEMNGRIVSLGEWILEQALLKIKEWQFRGTGIRLAINLSATQFIQQDFAQLLHRKLQEYDVSAKQLAIEVTESVILLDPHRMVEQLQRIHEMGVEIHLDDFGKNYGSVTRLKQLPFDVVKIEPQLIQGLSENPENKIMVKALVETIRAFGMEVVAEGVETAEQQAVLMEVGCNFHQGYLYAQPMDEKVFEQTFIQNCQA